MSTTVTKEVASRISQISPAVNEKVIQHLVDKEIDKRVDKIVSNLDTLTQLEKDLKKIRPDVGGSFDENGNETKPTQYSKAVYEQRKSLVEKIDKLKKALDLAIDKGDMSKLNELK